MRALALVLGGILTGCLPDVAPLSDGGKTFTDAGPFEDGGLSDAGLLDAGALDAGSADAGSVDAALPDVEIPLDAGELDAGEPDAGGLDAGELDAGEPDAGEPDAGEPDAGGPDAGEPGTPDGGASCFLFPGGTPNEDGDGRRDECDNCPLIENTGLFEHGDGDGDGIGDACEPVDVDERLLFEGFNGGGGNEWSATTGDAWRWTRGGGSYGAVVSGQNVFTLVERPIHVGGATRLLVVAKLRFLDIGTSDLQSVMVTLRADDDTLYGCGLVVHYDPEPENGEEADTLELRRLDGSGVHNDIVAMTSPPKLLEEETEIVRFLVDGPALRCEREAGTGVEPTLHTGAPFSPTHLGLRAGITGASGTLDVAVDAIEIYSLAP